MTVEGKSSGPADRAPAADGYRRSLGRLRLQNGMAVLFSAMGAMVALVLFDAVLPGDAGERDLIRSAFEAFKLIAVTVLGYIFGSGQARPGSGG